MYDTPFCDLAASQADALGVIKTWCKRPSLYALLNARNARAISFGALCMVCLKRARTIILAGREAAKSQFTLTVSDTF
jgi:hypothetical protein